MHGDLVAQQALRTIRPLTAASAKILEARLDRSPGKAKRHISNAKNDEEVYERVLRRKREAQMEFRKNVLHAYGHKCAITGVALSAAIDAAHILPHAQEGINRTANGIPLRCDLHALFDAALIRLHPKTLEVIIADSAHEYRSYSGKVVKVPSALVAETKAALAKLWRSNDSGQS